MLQYFDSCIAVISAMIWALRLPPAAWVASMIVLTLASWAVVRVEVELPPVE